ncbi:hypothetical protein [Streptomyces sioyaensis]|uniref:hypothetical protein n=1 Tax=Streptomyces sioyaensis TaxID=67364 RepID=UPI003D71D193
MHDPRVSRLLVLGCLAQFNRYVASDPRKNLVDLVSNPSRGERGPAACRSVRQQVIGATIAEAAPRGAPGGVVRPVRERL